MPTPSQNQDTRLLEGRLESQERQLDNLSQRMDKYDQIIRDLHTIVIALKAKSDTNQKWVSMMVMIGATILGAASGSGITVLLTHLASH